MDILARAAVGAGCAALGLTGLALFGGFGLAAGGTAFGTLAVISAASTVAGAASGATQVISNWWNDE